MKEIKEAGGEIGSGLFLGLGALGFFLMLGLCSTNNRDASKTNFQYCYAIGGLTEKAQKAAKKCFQNYYLSI